MPKTTKSPKKPKLTAGQKVRASEEKILYRAVCSRKPSPSHFDHQPAETWAAEFWGLAHLTAKKILPGRQTEKNVAATTHTIVLAIARWIREQL